MVLTPPSCPQCPDNRLVWKDTTRTRPGAEDHWTWYCTGCSGSWNPTAQHKEIYHGSPTGPERFALSAAT